MTRNLLCILVFLLALPSPSALERVEAASLRPSFHGRLFVTTGTKDAFPLTDARLQLFALGIGDDGGFALAKPGAPAAEGHTDPRGFYSFYDIPQGAYKLQVNGPRGIGGGSIVRVTGVTAAVPPMVIDWNDPCGHLYGTGYAVDYIRTKTDVQWRANAGDWLEFAGKSGWGKDRTSEGFVAPKQARAVAVFPATRTIPFGHVAWVDSVDTSRRTFVISQWNEPAPVPVGEKCWKTENFGKRTIKEWRFGDLKEWRFGDSVLAGFIYPPGP